MNFWANVVRLLEARGQSVRSLALEVGITPAAMVRYARGSMPGLDVAVRMAESLGVSLDALVYGQEEALARKACPAPDEHAALHELADELGLAGLVETSRLGQQPVAWQIANLLARSLPNPLSWSQIRDGVRPAAESAAKAGLASLIRRKHVIVRQDKPERLYTVARPAAEFTARDDGVVSQHVKFASRVLFGDVVPAIEAQDGSGHLLSATACVSRQAAQELADELRTLIKARVTQAMDEAAGDTDVKVVFGVAARPRS